MINIKHCEEVRKKRRELGLPVPDWNAELPDHKLLNRKLYKKKDRLYTIVKVAKHWYSGWYIVLLLVNDEDSSHLIFWENINCEDDLILSQIAEIRQDYFLKEK